jgi:transketolase
MQRFEGAPKAGRCSLRDAFALTLTALAHERSDIVLLDGDNANSSQAEIFAAAHPDRFLQMGIAEQNMVGVAAGLATMGYLPFVSAYACFQVYRAHDQIRVLVAQTGLPVRLVGGSAGLLFGLAGKTHQTPDDIAVMRSMPGMTVIAPGDEIETRQVLRWSLDYPGPLYLRLTRGTSTYLFDESHQFDFPKATLLRDGSDVTLISTGVQTSRVLDALPAIEAAGIDPLVIHVPTLKPLDDEAIVEAAERTGRVVTIEDHSIIGGLGGAVSELLSERRPTLVRRIGVRDVYAESATNDELLEKYGLSATAVSDSVIDWLAAG